MNNGAKEPYSAIASRYDEIVSREADYPKWADFVVRTVKEKAPIMRGADIACGSGYFTRALKRSGAEVFGVDISPYMLSEAKRLSSAEGLNIEYLSGDITRFKSLKKLGFVTAVNDAYNYIPEDKLQKAFSSVCSNLVRDGVFLFDISSEYKLTKVIGNNLFAEDTDDYTYLWFNSCDGEKVVMDITVFDRKGEVYTRNDERQVQYIHSAEKIKKSLSDAGFILDGVYSHLGGAVDENSERLVFIAIKR